MIARIIEWSARNVLLVLFATGRQLVIWRTGWGADA